MKSPKFSPKSPPRPVIVPPTSRSAITTPAPRPVVTPKPTSRLSVGEIPSRPGLALGRPRPTPSTSTSSSLPGLSKVISGVGIAKMAGTTINASAGTPADEKKTNLTLQNVDKWQALAAEKTTMTSVSNTGGGINVTPPGSETATAPKPVDSAWTEFQRARQEEQERVKRLAAEMEAKKRQAELEEKRRRDREEELYRQEVQAREARKAAEKAKIARMREEEKRAREERYKDTIDLFSQSIIMAKFEKEMYQNQDHVKRQKEELRRQTRLINAFSGKNLRPLTVLGQMSENERAALIGRVNYDGDRGPKEEAESVATSRAASEDGKSPTDMDTADTDEPAYEPANI